jgi:transcriptional regulator with XRE-family HTH domain
MHIDGTYAYSDEANGFPARLRQILDSYGTAVALAQAIGRSEGAIRKWLRGQSEPNVSDLRAICEATNTNVEWMVLGCGDPQRMEIREPTPCSCGQHGLFVRSIAARVTTLRKAPICELSPSDKRATCRPGTRFVSTINKMDSS